MSSLPRIGIPVFCVAVSGVFILSGGMSLLFTTGIYVLGPLVLLLYGVWNLCLLLIAFSGSNRRVAWLSGIPSVLTAIALMLVGDGPGVVIWCGVIFLNWLAIKRLADLQTATDATSDA
jgi:hypothetical protein